MYQADARSYEGEQHGRGRIAPVESALVLSGLSILSWALPIGGFWLVWHSFV